jgi:hypothetical protein
MTLCHQWNQHWLSEMLGGIYNGGLKADSNKHDHACSNPVNYGNVSIVI